MVADWDFVAAVKALVAGRLAQGHDDKSIHQDLQRGYVEGGGKIDVDYQLHRSGKPRLHWQQSAHG